MLNRISFTWLAVVVVVIAFAASNANAQYFECNTPVSQSDSLLSTMAPTYPSELVSAEILCFVHVLRESDGSGGLSQSGIDSMLTVAASDVVALGVALTVVGQEEILDSSYFTAPDSLAQALFQEDPHSDAIDIYLGPAVGTARGRASGIPGTALILTGDIESYSALSHLLGNCFGLFETDETVFGVENPDGSNSGVAGDLIADTPADPGLNSYVDADCSLSDEFETDWSGYSPDPTNIMSNSRMNCWSSFTAFQKARVLAALDNHPVLSTVASAVPDVGCYANFSSDTGIVSLFANVDDEWKRRSNITGFDYSGDSRKDAITSTYFTATAPDQTFALRTQSYDVSTSVPVFYDASTYTFTASGVFSPPTIGSVGYVLADYDNDGDLDFYAPNPNFHEGSIYSGPHRMYRNNGDGTFTNMTNTVFGSTEAQTATINAAWGDYDSDGYLDLAVGLNTNTPSPGISQDATGFRLYHNEQIPGGTSEERRFIDQTSTCNLDPTAHEFKSIFWVDFDQDCDMDLVLFNWRDANVAGSGGNDTRYYQNNSGSFSYSSSSFTDLSDTDAGETYAAPGDFDNDGDIDIVYHGKIIRGYFANQWSENSPASFTRGWFEEQPVGVVWDTYPADIDVFDADLDGWEDFGIASIGFVTTLNSRDLIYRNSGSQTPSFEPFSLAFLDDGVYRGVASRGQGCFDWNMDGFTEVFAATESSSPFFYRNQDAVNGTNSNHWVGIRLRAIDGACNTFGIGATVIITAGGHTQAQVVDGGSGNAGQGDLDLSFGLGSYSGDVDVEVLWPCGQRLTFSEPVDDYRTVLLGNPDIISPSITSYMHWIPTESTVAWVFEWETAYPSEDVFDLVELPDGVDPGDGGDDVTQLYAGSRSDVTASVSMTETGYFLHRIVWSGRPCDQIMTVPFRVHTVLGPQAYTTTRTFNLIVMNCPQN